MQKRTAIILILLGLLVGSGGVWLTGFPPFEGKQEEEKVYSSSDKDGPLTKPVEESSGKSKPVVGKLAPDFKVTDVQGKEFQLSDQKGRVVVVEFAITGDWCVPCAKQAKKLKEVEQKFGSEVEIITINISPNIDKKRIVNFREKYAEGRGRYADADTSPKMNLGAEYGVVYVPHFFIIDRNGYLRYQGRGVKSPDFLSRKIDELLKNEN